MKKNLFLACTVLVALSLMAFGYMNWSPKPTDQVEPVTNPTGPFEFQIFRSSCQPPKIDLVYNVDSRFIANITKENLLQAKTVVDLVPVEAEWDKVSFLSMKVAIIQDDGELSAFGENGVLTAEQINLLHDLDYSTSFYLNGRGKRKGDGQEGLMEFTQRDFEFAYYITLIPEKEAEYKAGYDALIAYLKESTKGETEVITEDKLQPGRVNFTVSKTGTVKHVFLDSTSGFPSVDEALLEAVRNMSGKWHPATNAKGEKVDQELVFFFGRQGC